MLFGVIIGVDGDITEGHRGTPAPIGKPRAKALPAVKERFGYRSEGVGVGCYLGNFTMRSCDDVSQIFGNAVNERFWGTHGSTLAKQALHCN
jgi:hypothetical protein